MDTSGLSEELQRLAHSYGVNKAKLDNIDTKVKLAKEKVESYFQKSLSKLNPKGKGYNKKRIRLNLRKEKRLQIIDKYYKTAKPYLTNKVVELKSKLIEETEKELRKQTKKINTDKIKNFGKNVGSKLNPKKMSGLKKGLISGLIASIIISAYTIAKKAEHKRNEELRKRG
jgi:hypothetical protein